MRSEPANVTRGVVLAALLALSACRSIERTAVAADAGPGARASAHATLHLLDDAHAGEFRAAFEQSMDRPRYVVALSPT